MKKKLLIAFLLLFIFPAQSFCADITNSVDTQIENQIEHLYETYVNLHKHPELSLMEKNTSKKLAEELKAIGFEVTENFGGYGVVGVFKNGEGPVILIRTDMDALPIKEKTGLDYASNVITKNLHDQDMPAMHACGHDMHMTVWLGVAKTLSNLKNEWKGTILMIAQPAEEIGKGAKLMLEKQLYKKFPRPNYALALHSDPNIATGKIGYRSGYVMASANNINIDVYGISGHGSKPEATIDPIVLSSKIILDLQTIISRNISPMDSAVITVGAINGGSTRNIIPDQVTLQLTVRTFQKDLEEKILSRIKQITDGNALATGLSKNKYPKITTISATPVVYNNPLLQDKLMASFKKSLGENNVVDFTPAMAAEDFSRYSDGNKIPIALFRLGISDEKKIFKGAHYPSLHSALLKIDSPKLAIKTGVKTMSISVIDLMKK